MQHRPKPFHFPSFPTSTSSPPQPADPAICPRLLTASSPPQEPTSVSYAHTHRLAHSATILISIPKPFPPPLHLPSYPPHPPSYPFPSLPSLLPFPLPPPHYQTRKGHTHDVSGLYAYAPTATPMLPQKPHTQTRSHPSFLYFSPGGTLNSQPEGGS